ncbi:MAG: hypothetical protein HUU16_22290 [Candidatus Omnitrophica bacterium]|nr:hypothetical protein [Candidatus Omnitrophota bacterium]
MPEKAFDCVKLKSQLQLHLADEWAGLTDEEIRQRVSDHLARSEDPVSRWWREALRKESASVS